VYRLQKAHAAGMVWNVFAGLQGYAGTAREATTVTEIQER
jgi:hypothetical protein